jgi:hypothetical protein
MNTAIIVWVLLIPGYGGVWNPTIEFKDQQKCVNASIIIKAETDSRRTFNIPTPICVRIEK